MEFGSNSSFGTPPSTRSDHCPNDGDIITLWDMDKSVPTERTIQVFLDESGTGYYDSPSLIPAPPPPPPLPQEPPPSPDVVESSGESSGELYVCSPTPPEESMPSEEDVSEIQSVFVDLMADMYDSSRGTNWKRLAEGTVKGEGRRSRSFKTAKAKEERMGKHIC